MIRLTPLDRCDLGAEFVRREFAAPLACPRHGFNPFDQPNVQKSKANTAAVLGQAQLTRQRPPTDTIGALAGLLAAAQPGDYLARMAYRTGTPPVETKLEDLRSAIRGHYPRPHTLAYGPCFLCSTGQLPKRGSNNGLFVRFAADWGDDLPVPGEACTLAGLATAQAIGDYASPVSHRRRAVRIGPGRLAPTQIRHLAAQINRAAPRRGLR